jgi:transcriptional regulator with XRE-family HTH domain
MGNNTSENSYSSWEKFFEHGSREKSRCTMGFLDDLKGLQEKIAASNQSELARDSQMKQQTINRLANDGLESVTAKNLAKLVDKFNYKLVEVGKGQRTEADITRDILQRVFDACAESPIDDASRIRILASVSGKKIAESSDHRHKAAGNE